MAQYCTCQKDHPTVYELQKSRVQHALHFDSVEILAVYRIGNLGGKEPEG